MQIDWFTFVAQVVNFLILIALLQRFLFKPVIKAMDERERKVASELEEARRNKVEAEQKQRELDDRLKEFEAEKDQMMDKARREVQRNRKEWMGQLRTEIAEIRERWLDAVESEKITFLENLKKETGQQFIALMQKVLSDLSERNLQQQTADFFLEKLDRLEDSEKLQIRQTIKQLQVTKADIKSSFELGVDQKQKLTNSLHQIAGDNLECSFITSSDLGFGMKVSIGGWRLGWNLESYLQELSKQMDQFFGKSTPMKESMSIK